MSGIWIPCKSDDCTGLYPYGETLCPRCGHDQTKTVGPKEEETVMDIKRCKRRPAEVEVVRFVDANKDQVHRWVINSWADHDDKGEPILKFDTLHGKLVRASFGDWIIKNIGGGFFVCPDEMFQLLYELVE